MGAIENYGSVGDPQIDQITTSKLAVDGQVKHCQITDTFAELQMDTDGPNVLQLQAWLLPDQFAFVPGFTGMNAFYARSQQKPQ